MIEVIMGTYIMIGVIEVHIFTRGCLLYTSDAADE